MDKLKFTEELSLLKCGGFPSLNTLSTPESSGASSRNGSDDIDVASSLDVESFVAKHDKIRVVPLRKCSWITIAQLLRDLYRACCGDAVDFGMHAGNNSMGSEGDESDKQGHEFRPLGYKLSSIVTLFLPEAQQKEVATGTDKGMGLAGTGLEIPSPTDTVSNLSVLDTANQLRIN
jgi:hypothetical protein